MKAQMTTVPHGFRTCNERFCSGNRNIRIVSPLSWCPVSSAVLTQVSIRWLVVGHNIGPDTVYLGTSVDP